MKFGKHLEARQIEIPEHNGYFIDYKGLKKLIKQLSALNISSTDVNDLSDSNEVTTFGSDSIDDSIVHRRLQENQASFFFKLERELEKVNSYYLEKELSLHIKYDILQKKFDKYKARGKLNSKDSMSYKTLLGGIKKFQKDLDNLGQFVKLNRTGFLKALKKWDKRSHSQQKEFYFATVISVQPIFTKNDISTLNDSILSLLIALDEICNKSFNSQNESGSKRNSNRSSIENESLIPNMRDRIDSDTLNLTNDGMNTRLSPSSMNLQQMIVDQNKLQNMLDLEMDIESEVEDWSKELIYMDKINDELRKKNMVSSFFENKIKPNMSAMKAGSTSEIENLYRNSITRLFLLLIDSELCDKSLQVFYDSVKIYVDLSYFDENDMVFSRRNILHESARCLTQSRHFILAEALTRLTSEELFKLINAKDFHLRTPLHYASELGKSEFVKLMIQSKMIEFVDSLDNNSHTPLSMAIMNKYSDIVKILLIEGNANPSPESTEDSNPQFAPLNIACEYDNYEAVKLLLERGSINVNNTIDHRGQGSLHIVAKKGGSRELIKLLIDSGANPNGIDEFNKWTPLFYAVQGGHTDAVAELLNDGAEADVFDGNDRSPLFYAIWEGHIDVLNLILKRIDSAESQKKISSTSGTLASNTINIDDDFDEIPNFTLPPPIIPLRKYGHNFLEKKTFFKIILKTGQDFIKLNQDDDILTLAPGRITLTSNALGTFPRNIILPIKEEEEGEVIFQVDSFDAFAVDFEIYPSYGTKLIAKTSVIPEILHSRLVDGFGTAYVPLFDYKLKNIGTLSFDYRVIFPCNVVKPLDISKYETYWKSTTNDNTVNNSTNEFVTSSSLRGSYLSVKASSLKDGTIVITPSVYLELGKIKLFMLDLNKEQLESIVGYNIDELPEIHNSTELKGYLSTRIVTLKKLLVSTPSSIQLDIQVSYPTHQEFEQIIMREPNMVNLNSYIDSLLLITFEHIRDLRHSGKSLRSIVFSSANLQACSIINWKQPNFAVIFVLNSLYKVNNKFILDTAHRLKNIVTTFDQTVATDANYYCIREMIRLSANNNFLGIVIPNEILKLCSQLGEIIRSSGLLLITSSETRTEKALLDENINGILAESELEFSRIN